MGTKNRERRAGKKRARAGSGRAGPTPAGGRRRLDEPPPPPPPVLSVEDAAASASLAAGGHVHGDRDALSRCVSALEARCAPGRSTAERGVEVALLRDVTNLWQHGWLPLDLVEHARRTLPEPAQALLVEVVAAEATRYASASMDPRWHDQIVRAGAEPRRDQTTPLVSRWAGIYGLSRTGALTEAVGLLATLHALPVLERILPPPGSPDAQQARRGAAPAGVDPKVLARVRALLAKAESSSFPEEAEALSAKAQELMNRYALEQAVVDAADSTPQSATACRLWLDSPYVAAKSSLVSAVADANRCHAVSFEKLELITVVGHQTDLEVVELLVTSLLVQANRAMLHEGRRTHAGGRARSRSFRQSFLLAYAARIGERLRHATDASSSGIRDERLLPALADRAEAVETTFADMFPNVVHRSFSIRDAAGWQAGRTAADAARLGLDRDRLARNS